MLSTLHKKLPKTSVWLTENVITVSGNVILYWNTTFEATEKQVVQQNFQTSEFALFSANSYNFSQNYKIFPKFPKSKFAKRFLLPSSV